MVAVADLLAKTTAGSSRAHRIVIGEETYNEQQAVREERVKSESKKRKRNSEREVKSDIRPLKSRRHNIDRSIPFDPSLRAVPRPGSYREPYQTRFFDDPDDATYVPSVLGD